MRVILIKYRFQLVLIAGWKASSAFDVARKLSSLVFLDDS